MEGARVFLPAWAAPASMYRRGVPTGWTVLDPPSFHATRGLLDRYQDWLVGEVRAHPGAVALAGHSMGGALALLAAAAEPDRVSRLVLLSPAGLPLRKPIRASFADFVVHLALGRFQPGGVALAASRVGAAPVSALRLALAVRDLDLTAEMRTVRAAGVEATVIGCETDTLVTSEHCRRMARLLAASYRELALEGGHVWMFARWQRLASELQACA